MASSTPAKCLRPDAWAGSLRWRHHPRRDAHPGKHADRERDHADNHPRWTLCCSARGWHRCLNSTVGARLRPAERNPKETAGADAKSAAGSGPTTAAKTPGIGRANSIRHVSGLGRTVKRDLAPRHATPFSTPRNASNVVDPTAGKAFPGVSRGEQDARLHQTLHLQISRPGTAYAKLPGHRGWKSDRVRRSPIAPPSPQLIGGPPSPSVANDVLYDGPGRREAVGGQPPGSSEM
jgi:hypothetical protein